MCSMLARLVNSLPTGISQRITKIYFQESEKAKKLAAHIKRKILTRNQRGFHSKQESHSLRTMDIKVLPALQDNYMYLIVCKKTKEAAIVDPVEPKTVLEAINNSGVKLTAVLTTHHHWDHAGGNEELVQSFPGIKVYGGDIRIGALTSKVGHNTRFNIGDLFVHCLFTPCHTSGHICYYVSSKDVPNETAVFTGDTLFIGGCGRFFEGDATQMYNALVRVLGILPETTKVFCGHEYTMQNLKFATIVDPTNEEVNKKLTWAQERRKAGQPTVPSTIGDEKLYNPFMRVQAPAILQYAQTNCAIQAMQFIRQEKDNFRG